MQHMVDFASWSDSQNKDSGFQETNSQQLMPMQTFKSMASTYFDSLTSVMDSKWT